MLGSGSSGTWVTDFDGHDGPPLYGEFTVNLTFDDRCTVSDTVSRATPMPTDTPTPTDIVTPTDTPIPSDTPVPSDTPGSGPTALPTQETD
ncbi:MAG: hypothetical protein MAG431_00814 [Chloroflexi bacterium]|nr:hypothetical protein [Chloroflexota bacterium]